VPTAAGFLYLAVVLDAWSRKIVGWSMANHLRAELVLDAMEAAVGQRRPKDVIHHSDQGSQYTSVAFGKRCGEAGVRPSMGSVGDACDNAMAESFFSTLEAELLSRRRFASQAEARMACFSYIEGWYNPARLHSGLGYRSPMTYKPRARPPRSSRSQQARKLSTRTGRPHFASGRQVPVFLTEACLEVTPPSCRTPVGPSAGTSQPLLAGQKCRSRFRRRLNT
jgi:putative transposase